MATFTKRRVDAITEEQVMAWDPTFKLVAERADREARLDKLNDLVCHVDGSDHAKDIAEALASASDKSLLILSKVFVK